MDITAHYNEHTDVLTVFCEKCGIPARIRALGNDGSVDFMPESEKKVDGDASKERGQV